MKKAKKVKRVVLGVGHPWFDRFGERYPHCTAIGLTPRRVPVGASEIVPLKGSGRYGNWNKVRLVLEVLE